MKAPASWSRKQAGLFEGWLSIATNTALFAAKLWVGVASGSIAMIADAWHTLSDSLTSAVVIAGFWLSDRPADREHPFGHGRAELAAGLVIGTLLAVVGVAFFRESLQRLARREVAAFAPLALVVFGLSAVLKEALAQISFRLGRRTGSTSLKADAWHHRSDAIASALIALGAVAGRRFWFLDGGLGIGVSLLIVLAALSIIRENTGIIMGESLPVSRREEIIAFVLGFSPEISDVHHFHVHRYGDHSELTFHIRVRQSMDVGRAHRLSSEVEAALKAKFGLEVTIHVEPERRAEEHSGERAGSERAQGSP